MKKLIYSYRLKFLESLGELRGYSDLTLKSYDESIKEALEYVEITKDKKNIVINLMPYRIKIAHLNPKTITKKLSAIHTFVDFLNENKLKIILKADESIKVAKTLPKPIPHKYIIEALQYADIKEQLIIKLLYTCSLRISELVFLRLEDISTDWIRVLGEGSKHRDIPIFHSLKKLIDDYIELYTPKIYLFEKDSKILNQNHLRYIVNKVFKRISLKVTPHQLRHSYASELLNGGAPIVDVSELLGHSSMATTQIYTKLGSALKQQNYNKAHPLCITKE